MNKIETRKNHFEEIRDILVGRYGLKNPVLSDAPRGFVAETYIVESEGLKYFAKISRASRYSKNLEASLPVLHELHKKGIENIGYPISATSGELTVVFCDKVLALFNFINGKWTFDYDFEKYAKLLGNIHAKTNDIKIEVRREAFDLPFVADLRTQINQILAADDQDDVEKELKDLIIQYREEFLEAIAQIQNLSENLRRQNLESFITHGDAPGNVLKDTEGNVYLIDWDDLLLAPAERDTWFHINTNRETEFLKVYYKFNPNYQVNFDAYAFYLYRRYLEDLEGFISKILEAGAINEQKKKNLEGLKKDCLSWLRPLVQKPKGSR